MIRLWFTGIVLLVVCLLANSTAHAQTGTAEAATEFTPPTIMPANLTLEATTGVGETHTLVLRATSPITALQIIELDMQRMDNKGLLPPNSVTVLTATAPTNLAAGD